VTRLETLGGAGSSANDISNVGMVVGGANYQLAKITRFFGPTAK